MGRFFKQTVVTLFFAGQLAAVWALSRTETQYVLPPDKALERYGFYLRESAQEAGLIFKHESPRELDVKLRHILPIIASMGASVSIVDYDNDGLLDIYVVTSREGGKNKLFR